MAAVCRGWSYILGAVLALFIGLIDLLSLYGVHINYRAVTDCARSTIGFLTLCYVPIGVIMLHSAGAYHDSTLVQNVRGKPPATTIYLQG